MKELHQDNELTGLRYKLMRNGLVRFCLHHVSLLKLEPNYIHSLELQR